MGLIGDVPLVEFIYKRCRLSSEADFVAVITSDDRTDDVLYDYCVERQINIFRGDLDNVLDRYIKAAEFYHSDVICRVCGDSPFVDVGLIDRMFQIIGDEKCDYVAPDQEHCIAGLDSEVFTIDALRRVVVKATSKDDLEHVTHYIRNHAGDFNLKIITAELRHESLRDAVLTVDYPEDLLLGNSILGVLGNGHSFSSDDIFRVLCGNMHLLGINRNRGAN